MKTTKTARCFFARWQSWSNGSTGAVTPIARWRTTTIWWWKPRTAISRREWGSSTGYTHRLESTAPTGGAFVSGALQGDPGGQGQQLSRYVVLNPVRVGMVEHPGDWPWSRFGASVGDALVRGWLATDGLLAQFGRRRNEARRRCRKFVAEDGTSVGSGPRQQIYLADDTFVAKMQEKVPVQTDQLNIPRSQRRGPAPPLEAITAEHPECNAAIVAAHATGACSYCEIADHFGLHPATVVRVIRSRMLSRVTRCSE